MFILGFSIQGVTNIKKIPCGYLAIYTRRGSGEN